MENENLPAVNESCHAKDADGLNAKQLRFCQEYVVDSNALQSAIRAGYSENCAGQIGYELLKKPEVKRKIGELQGDVAASLGIDAQYVLKTIIDTIERCSQAKPVYDANGFPVVIETPDGQLAHAYKFDSKAVLKGTELLGKHLKLFTEIKELRGPGGGAVKVEDVTNQTEALRAYQEALKGIR
jgi:phage terminase small subunit